MVPSLANISRVTAADLAALVENRVSESVTLEFKAEPWSGKSAMKEWCKDISAMANSEGGCIVVGMKEKDAVAEELVGVAGRAEELKRRLGQAAEANIDPRIAIQFEPVDLSPGRFALLCATSRSRFAPHMSRADGDMRIYKRTNTHVEKMSTDEIRRTVLSSKSQEELVVERHQQHLAGSSNPSLGFALVLDFFPVPLDLERVDPSKVDIDDLSMHVPSLTRNGRQRPRYTFHGFSFSGTPDQPSETQVHRTGAILSWHDIPTREPGHVIATIWFIERMLKAITGYFDYCRALKIDDLSYSCLTLDGCSRYSLTDEFAQPIGHRTLTFAPILLEPRTELPSKEDGLRLLEPWLHRLWNASGLQRCRYLDEALGHI